MVNLENPNELKELTAQAPSLTYTWEGEYRGARIRVFPYEGADKEKFLPDWANLSIPELNEGPYGSLGEALADAEGDPNTLVFFVERYDRGFRLHTDGEPVGCFLANRRAMEEVGREKALEELREVLRWYSAWVRGELYLAELHIPPYPEEYLGPYLDPILALEDAMREVDARRKP